MLPKEVFKTLLLGSVTLKHLFEKLDERGEGIMSNINEELIKDRLTKTCPCRQVTRHTIKEAIKSGATTLERVKASTGAMTGCCKGSRCKGSIEDLIQRYSDDF